MARSKGPIRAPACLSAVLTKVVHQTVPKLAITQSAVCGLGEDVKRVGRGDTEAKPCWQVAMLCAGAVLRQVNSSKCACISHKERERERERERKRERLSLSLSLSLQSPFSSRTSCHSHVMFQVYPWCFDQGVRVPEWA